MCLLGASGVSPGYLWGASGASWVLSWSFWALHFYAQAQCFRTFGVPEVFVHSIFVRRHGGLAIGTFLRLLAEFLGVFREHLVVSFVSCGCPVCHLNALWVPLVASGVSPGCLWEAP